MSSSRFALLDLVSAWSGPSKMLLTPPNLKASSVLGHHEIPTNKRHDAQELPGEEAFQPRGIRFQIFVDIPQRISSHFARGSKRLEQVYLAACGFKQNLGTSLNSGRVP